MGHETHPDSDPMGTWKVETRYYFIYGSRNQIVAESNSVQ